MGASAEYLGHVALWFDASGGDDTSPRGASPELIALLARIRAGEHDAFEELLTSVVRPLEAYARRFTGSREEASDLVQDVFAHLWECRATVHVRGSVRAYLYTAVRHRAIDVQRRDSAEALRLTRASDAGHPVGMAQGSYAADADADHREIAARVTEALNGLPPRAREAALLRWADGLSRTEIAAVMGIAIPTVKNHLALAATTIRGLLADLREQS
jgi:RNA polymerase sigma-70 factor (ECF subfamily)